MLTTALADHACGEHDRGYIAGETEDCRGSPETVSGSRCSANAAAAAKKPSASACSSAQHP